MSDPIVIVQSEPEPENEGPSAEEVAAEVRDEIAEELEEVKNEIEEVREEAREENTRTQDLVTTSFVPDYGEDIANILSRLAALEQSQNEETIEESNEDVEFTEQPLAEDAEREPDEVPEKTHWWMRPWGEWFAK